MPPCVGAVYETTAPTLPKGPTSIRSTSWYSLLPEYNTRLTRMVHFKSSARSSSSCGRTNVCVVVQHASGLLLVVVVLVLGDRRQRQQQWDTGGSTDSSSVWH